MSNWDKNLFIDHLRDQCSREVAKVGVSIIDFTEKHADDISWGRGTDHGTLTFRCNSDAGPLPLFHMTSTGQLNLQINFMRNKEIPPMVLRDVVLKLESRHSFLGTIPIASFADLMFDIASIVQIPIMAQITTQA